MPCVVVAASMPALKSTPTARRRRFLQLVAEIASPAGQIDHEFPGLQTERRHSAAAPASVQPKRQQPVEQVVARRNLVEHRFDGLGLVLGLRQPGLGRIHWNQMRRWLRLRGWKMSTSSKHVEHQPHQDPQSK